MSRPGITYQEVMNSALQLQGQNENPTVDRVREILGTGSKSTIARYLREWKAKNGHLAGADGVPSELISMVKGLWERVKEEADKQIAQHEQESQRRIEEAQQRLDQEQKRNATLQAQTHQLEERLHEEKHLTSTLSQSLDEEKCGTVKLTERNERITQQLNDKKLETDRLHQLLSHVQANLEHYQASVQKLREEQVLSMEKQRATYEAEISTYKKEIHEISQVNNQLQRHYDRLQSELVALKDQHETASTERAAYYQQLQEKIMIESNLKNNCDQLTKSCNDFQILIEDKTKTLIESEKNNAILANQLESLKGSLQNAQDTIRILRDEKLYLAQEKAHLEGQFKQLQVSL